MSRLTTGILVTIVLSLISGAAQFAMGRDMSRDLGRDLSHDLPAMPIYAAHAEELAFDRLDSFSLPSDRGSIKINRGAKADRVSGPLGSPARTKTVLLRLDGFSNMSFLLRLPIADANSSPSPKPDSKPMVACEQVVSVLTDVARQLQPGRCVT